MAVILCLTSVISVMAIPTTTMKLGSKGPDVIALQQKLVENGYLDEKYLTGFYGPNTVEAVKKYQKENGIKQTGVVAEKTIEALFVKKELDPTLVLKKGDESNNVKLLQQALVQMGYLAEDKVTGYYGDVTEAAVKKFQKENGISQTGTAAKLTIEKINTIINGTKLEIDRVYKSGDEDEGVKELQQRLYELGYHDKKYVTGYYGAITVAAVKKFQKNNQISETGTVAKLTLEALNSASAKINKVDSSGLAERIAKPGTLRYGDTGAQVKNLQNDLKKLGYFSGEATGEFGNVTKQAVIKFQKAYSLTADGIAGTKTLAKIKSAVSGKTNSSTSSSSSSSSASSSGVTVSGYTSANMEVVNSALATLTPAQLEEVKLMARIIKREVGGKSYKCQLAVGSVIMNRVANSGLSVREVIFSPNQFSTANSSIDRETYSTSNYYAALEAYMGVKPVGNCRYFCSKSVRYTCWAGKNRTFYTMIDTECFFL
ncbi:MAG: peptidoglycan-binding protein [Clostridia bacterium]|nr:peptidoglycan-binding protein [Clostridia bacterium]